MERIRKQNSRNYQGVPRRGMERVYHWIEASRPWATCDNQPDHGVPIVGIEGQKLQKYRNKRLKQKSTSGAAQPNTRHLGPRQQMHFGKKDAQRDSNTLGPRSTQFDKSPPRSQHASSPKSQESEAIAQSKRYAPPRLQKRRLQVDKNSSWWAKNTSLKEVLAVPGTEYPDGTVETFYEAFNDDVKCELRSGATRVSHGGRIDVGGREDQVAGGRSTDPKFDERMKSYFAMASFMYHQYNQNNGKPAPANQELTVHTTQPEMFAPQQVPDQLLTAPSTSPLSTPGLHTNSTFNDIVKSTTGHDMHNSHEITDISLGAPLSPVSVASPSENSSLPSELYECCVDNVKQSSAKKRTQPTQFNRNIHPNSPYYRKICNIASPFGVFEPSTVDASTIDASKLPPFIDDEVAARKAIHPVNSSMLSTGQPAGTGFNKNGQTFDKTGQTSGYVSEMMMSKHFSDLRLDSVGNGRLSGSYDHSASTTNLSGKLVVGEAVSGHDSNIRRINENSQEHMLKRTYGEFYCRQCDRSWCSNNGFCMEQDVFTSREHATSATK